MEAHLSSTKYREERQIAESTNESIVEGYLNSVGGEVVANFIFGLPLYQKLEFSIRINNVHFK
jgi:hypothetical protein